MEKDKYKILLAKYLKGSLSPDELEDFLNQTEANESTFFEEIDKINVDQLEGDFQNKNVYQKIVGHPDFPTPGKRKIRPLMTARFLRIAAAVIVFGVIGLITHQYISRENEAVVAHSTGKVTKDNVLLSGKNSVTMDLADGTQMIVDNSTFDQKIVKDGVTIEKDAEGAIVFRLTSNDFQSGSGEYHIFSTPKGEGFAFVLPDGSRIWMNSSTELKIPTNFNHKNRDIYLKGEAYFDVAHNKNKPFKIHSNNDIIQVLGTSFNVKAYPSDLKVYTTLVEGTVQVTATNEKLILSPGEQSVSNVSTGSLIKHKVDTDQYISWKNGQFKFVDQPISEILNDLMRWYDIREIKYEVRSTERFTASIKRSKSLAEVLKNIERVSSLQFKIEEGRVLVKDK